MLHSLIAVALLSAVGLVSGIPDCPPEALTVNTSNGLITGHIAPDTPSVAEYLGVPYAQPPVGELRFEPPKRLSTKRPFNASDWGANCPATHPSSLSYPGLTPQGPRIIKNFLSGSPNTVSEDCLTLNIWTKHDSFYHNGKKPVFVFLYGGRFAAGQTDTPFYNGKRFSEAQDVIVVTVNCRTNIFGFPGAPGHAQNVGLRDQRMAIEWLRDNIQAFGGNPRNIILFGQSAGAVSVDYYSYAFSKDPIVNGIISHSGNALSFGLNSAKLTSKNWYEISDALGCGASGDTIQCVKQKDWESIEAAAAKIKSTVLSNPVRSIPAFGPSVDNRIVFSDYRSLAKDGKFAKIPYLLGNNDNEGGFYAIAAYAAGFNVTQAQKDEFLLGSFTCPNSFEAQKRKLHDVPVWQYRYCGDWDNLRLYNGSDAYHGVDMNMIFGNSAEVSGIEPSEAEKLTTALMQFYWASFARDPHHGLSRLGWPQYEANHPSLNRLAYENSPLPNFVKPEVYDAPCSTITLGAEQTAT